MNILAGVSRECQEAEKKGRNVIVFGLNEVGEAKDEAKVDELMSVLKIKAGSIKRVFRIGKFDEKTSTGPRPLVVELMSDTTRVAVLKSSRSLRTVEEFKGVFIRQDLTPAQRMMQKKLIEMRNAKNRELPNGSDHYFGIRDGRIEKIRRIPTVSVEFGSGDQETALHGAGGARASQQ